MTDRPNIVARLLDVVANTVAPTWGVARATARARLDASARRSTSLRYDAARSDRTRRRAVAGSADGDLLPDLEVLRRKSRDLVRDDAHASAAVAVKLENVVGAGLKVQADVRADLAGISQQQADDYNNQAERIWQRWASDHCDATECSDFDEMTRQVYRARLLDGEAFVHRVAVPGREISTSWELIDPDRIGDDMRSTTDNVRGGIEFGSRGQPVAYYVSPFHADEARTQNIGANKPERIARKTEDWHNLLHVFRRLRPGQTRGEPLIVPAMPLFEHLHHYLDSEIIAARANSCIALYVERPVDPIGDPDITQEIAAAGDAGSQWHETIEPGTIEYLNAGEKISPYMPNRPGTTFDPFVVRVLRAICAALGLPYEMVVKDFGGMNYSSARVSLLEARRGFELEQSLLISQWLRPVWRTVMQEAIAAGLLPQFPQAVENPEPFLAARWIRPAWGWVDPVKEAEASRVAIVNNLSTPDREAARAGMDAEEVLRARARHMVRARDIEQANDLPPGSLNASLLSDELPSPVGAAADEPQTTPTAGDEDDAAAPGDAAAAAAAVKQRDTGADPAEVAARLNAVAIAMRAGLITPQQHDEEDTRARVGLPPMSAEVVAAWSKETTRRPITLARVGEELDQQPAADDPEQPNNQPN